MKITCPHCGFSKELQQNLLPEDATKANCPKCRQSFLLQPEVQDKPLLEAINIEPPRQTATQVKAQTNIDAVPKAGFWLRVIAALLDALIVFVLQFSLGALLALAGVVTSGPSEGSIGTMAILRENMAMLPIGGSFWIHWQIKY